MLFLTIPPPPPTPQSGDIGGIETPIDHYIFILIFIAVALIILKSVMNTKKNLFIK